jgi:membrane-bound lytic murein transglycosylase MltF
LSVGWTDEHWPTLNRIMYRESHCQPEVRNRSGASGLLQIMPMWADDCGGVPAQLFDPLFNLACGVYVLGVQGWQAWSTY